MRRMSQLPLLQQELFPDIPLKRLQKESQIFALNTVLVYVLGFDQMIGSELVMADAASKFIGGNGAAIVTIIILISLIGANNGFILTSARINYAMARDNRFFKQAAIIHPKFQSPANALIIQCIWACILTFSGTFNQLITYIYTVYLLK